MDYKLLHIFRNTPFGRETFLQSLYFCKTIKASPVVYIPKSDKFLFYFSNDVIQVDLDSSYLTDPDTAEDRARALLTEQGIKEIFLTPKNYTASSLPDLPPTLIFYAAPGLSVTCPAKSAWDTSAPRSGGSSSTPPSPYFCPAPCSSLDKYCRIVRGIRQRRQCPETGSEAFPGIGIPLDIYTLMEGRDQEYYRETAQKQTFWEMAEPRINKWHFWEKDQFDQMLYDIPHDALLVLGAYGHGALKDILFAAKWS